MKKKKDRIICSRNLIKTYFFNSHTKRKTEKNRFFRAVFSLKYLNKTPIWVFMGYYGFYLT